MKIRFTFDTLATCVMWAFFIGVIVGAWITR